VPSAIFTPASIAFDSDCFARGKTSPALAWSDFGWSEMSQFSVSAHVETRNVPVSTHSLDGVVGDHHSVLDAVDVRVDRGVDRGVAVAVRRDPQAATVRFVGDGCKLLG
jgi:hypothetical protein